MSNGFIRHKKVQWVFDNSYELHQFTPKFEGAYALDNGTGDIYVWNGYDWMMYHQRAVIVPAREPKIKQYYRNYNFPQAYTSSAATGSIPTASRHYFMVEDVDIMIGNYLFGTNNAGAYRCDFVSSSVEITAGTGYIYDISSSYQAYADNLIRSGSFMYQTVSMSIA